MILIHCLPESLLSLMAHFWASVADGGIILNHRWVFATVIKSVLNATFNN